SGRRRRSRSPTPGCGKRSVSSHQSSAPPSCCGSSPTSRSARWGASSTSPRRRRARTCAKGSRSYGRSTQMTNSQLSDLQAAPRAGAAVQRGAAAAAAAVTPGAAADRAGLVDVAVSTVDSPVGDLFVAVTPKGLVRLAFDPERVLDELAERISPRVVEAPARLDPVRRELDEYFAGRRRAFDLAVDWSLTSRFPPPRLQAPAPLPTRPRPTA